MKKLFKITTVAAMMLMLNVVFVSTSIADNPPPPPAHGETGNQVPGGGAPIGSGALILALLGAGYGGVKLYRKK